MSLSVLDVALDGVVISGVVPVWGLALLLCNMELFLLTLPAPPFYSAPPLRLPSQTEQINSPQEVTLEGARQPSAVIMVTTKETRIH